MRRDHRSSQREREPRTNRRIRAREVMVIDDGGEKLGVMPIDVALRRAEEQGLDLVEVAPEAKPPVCKILDFGKQKYLAKKKQAETKRHTTHQELKEVKLRPKTDEHDYEFKLKHVQRFLKGGDKVKVTLMFRGREVIHKDIAFKRLEEIAKAVEGLGMVEVAPRMEQRFMFMILAPDKKAMARIKSRMDLKKAEAKKAERAARAAERAAAEGQDEGTENGGQPAKTDEEAPANQPTEAKAEAKADA